MKVTSVTLWNGNTFVTNNSEVTVAHGTYSTLNCTPSFSRPNAVIVWYVGQKEVQRGVVSTFTHLFNDSCHDKFIYCRAFNILENEAVESNRLLLYVTGTEYVDLFFNVPLNIHKSDSFCSFDFNMVLK